MQKRLCNDGWQFALREIGGGTPGEGDWRPVEIPHDWLIWDTTDLYRSSEGWYRKALMVPADGLTDACLYLRFDGVYMDTTVYINGVQAFCWKYGYSTFTFEATPFLREGENQIVVRVVYQSPNSRWYSGAGIYRNVWLLEAPAIHILPDGVYISPHKTGEGLWQVDIDTELNADWTDYEAHHSVADAAGRVVATTAGQAAQSVAVSSPDLWDLETPALYTLQTFLYRDGQEIQRVRNTFGFREIDFRPESGFWLNGRHVKIFGACQHHDLGCLGAAFNRDAQRRQLEKLREMGVNAIRTAHNMPAPELMELADQMGFLVCSEAFDMWERSKTQYDYARFFPEWAAKDVASWIRRDRNCPSVIMWSIGNEIYDTHADERGVEITQMLCSLVRQHDPKGHAPTTIGSNYMPWENAQRCADIVKLAGYNYAEKYYGPHHAEHPDWIIYGSETSSVVQSRGIYHFPLRQPLLADDDQQCSALGNSSTSWGARSSEACIRDDMRAPFSAGQFIWTGTDYIGEPTPYHTKNSYFGQIDTAGFAKDSFYVFQSAWTDWRTTPMVHIFPYWDFSPGQIVDIRVCSNAPQVELFVNGLSLGKRGLGLSEGRWIADYQALYAPGELKAIAYDPAGQPIAEQTRHSFGDAVALSAETDRNSAPAEGQSLLFVTLSALDAAGYPVENASNRVRVEIGGAGRLVGLDNGDSTDYDAFKGTSKCLFSGKLLAVIATGHEPGEIQLTATSAGLAPVSLTLSATPAEHIPGASDHLLASRSALDVPGLAGQIPVRKIELLHEGTLALSARQPTTTIQAVLHPENASDQSLEWSVTNAGGIPSIIAGLQANGSTATLTAIGDGEVWLRCMSRSGGDHVRLISQLCFTVSGLGEPFLNPYSFVSGGLYTRTNAELTNGNERGVATPRDGESYVAFDRVDFGGYGSDTLTLPIFSLSAEPFPIEIWEGIPGEPGSELLLTPTYASGSQWNTYLPETYALPRRLKGVATLSFLFRQKVHLKGFSFAPAQKAFARLHAGENDALYGDSFRVVGPRIESIGNNVTLRFADLDFSAQAPASITIWGRTPLEKCSIHLHFRPQQTDAADTTQILEIPHSEEYATHPFPLGAVAPGVYDLEFVFLPGSNFDFDGFQCSADVTEGL